MSATIDQQRKLHVSHHDAAEMGSVAADLVAGLVEDLPRAVIGLATGSSPLPLYQSLARRHLDLAAVRWFALDEYIGLPAGHPESYAAVIEREVITPLGIDPAAVLLPDAGRPDADQAAADYEAAIAAAGGIDLQILGIGHNGHLAFNEPGSALDSRTRVEVLTPRTRRANARFFDCLDDVPTRCITQGLGTILAAKRLLLLVQGRDKAEALRQALTGPVHPDCPASVLQLHPDVTVLTDPEAASLLPAGAASAR
ncbi:MAG TPA: glucosamine-6-phosphate deaminase [Arthrobacter sp.]|nr:glucosamine-6-phosphate deaminase [Arthrobacter sp.]